MGAQRSSTPAYFVFWTSEEDGEIAHVVRVAPVDDGAGVTLPLSRGKESPVTGSIMRTRSGGGPGTPAGLGRTHDARGLQRAAWRSDRKSPRARSDDPGLPTTVASGSPARDSPRHGHLCVARLVPNSPRARSRATTLLGVLIDKFNVEMKNRTQPELQKSALVELRDALAHGRIAATSPSGPPRLIKFDRPQNGRVRVTYNDELNEAWFKRQTRQLILACAGGR